jgi:hypothetical protein
MGSCKTIGKGKASLSTDSKKYLISTDCQPSTWTCFRSGLMEMFFSSIGISKINMTTKMFSLFRIFFIVMLSIMVCNESLYAQSKQKIIADSGLVYKRYTPGKSDRIVSRSGYLNKMYGFWLGQCIANWTGLVTEMDKIGNIGEIKTGDFYTRNDWGKSDLPSIWG